MNSRRRTGTIVWLFQFQSTSLSLSRDDNCVCCSSSATVGILICVMSYFIYSRFLFPLDELQRDKRERRESIDVMDHHSFIHLFTRAVAVVFFPLFFLFFPHSFPFPLQNSRIFSRSFIIQFNRKIHGELFTITEAD